MTRAPGFMGMPARIGAALAALLLSFGLPWGVVGERSRFDPGYWISVCHTDMDGALWCTPYWTGGGVELGPGDPIPGFQSPARVGLVIVIALVVLHLRGHGSARLLWAAGAVLIASAALVGSAMRPGAVAAIIAAVLLAAEARGSGERPWASRGSAARPGVPIRPRRADLTGTTH